MYKGNLFGLLVSFGELSTPEKEYLGGNYFPLFRDLSPLSDIEESLKEKGWIVVEEPYGRHEDMKIRLARDVEFLFVDLDKLLKVAKL